MKLNDFGKTNLGDFINHFFMVPNYQRDYAWEEDNIKDFYDDILYTKASNSEHFLGQIVLNAVPSDANNETYYIIDGQQRITTVFIFLKALYDKLNEIDTTNTALMKGISRVLIKLETVAFGTDCTQPNLVVGSENNQFFINNIIQGKPQHYKKNAPVKKARRLYSDAYHFFAGKLGEVMDKAGSPDEQLEELSSFCSCVLENVYVMYLKTYKLNEAFVIFETLNARGRDLAAADLLKNKIMTYISDGNAPVQLDNWNSFIDVLGPTIEPTKFIRSYWNSIKQFTREKQLYRVISENINGESDSINIIKELTEMAPVYHDIAVASGSYAYFSDDTDVDVLEIRKYLDYLKWLGAKTFFPIILALVKKSYSNKEVLSVLKIIERYVFRNFTICGEVANSAEVFFSDVARSISNDRDPRTGNGPCTTSAIISTISDKIANDTKFEDGLKNWRSESSKDAIRYFFSRIHSYHYPHTSVIRDWKNTHIEHIMPVNPGNWPHITKEVHSEYLWCLGNLTLLASKLNIGASNDPFVTKRDNHYKLSDIYSTEMLMGYTVWTKNEIEDRLQSLISDALVIWS